MSDSGKHWLPPHELGAVATRGAVDDIIERHDLGVLAFTARGLEFSNEHRDRGLVEDVDGEDAARQVVRIAERFAAGREAENPSFGKGPRTYEAWELDPETSKPLQGFATANAARSAVDSASKGAERTALGFPT